jgi:hypothetical protein
MLCNYNIKPTMHSCTILDRISGLGRFFWGYKLILWNSRRL